MYTGNVVSYKAIMDKQYRDFGFDIDDESGLIWLAEFMAHTKTGVVMDSKIAYLTVCDGRAELPFDLYKIVQTALMLGIETIQEAECGEGTKIPMRWSTDNFHKAYHKDERDYTCEGTDTYTVGQGFIFTSFDKGIVSLSYEAIPTDEEGFPTIPEDQSWMEAACHYIAFKEARKRWIREALNEKIYREIERDKEWYFAQAVNTKFPQNVDQMESMKNAVLRTIPDVQAHNTFFANMQIPERRHFRSPTSRNSNSVNSNESKHKL